jgi:hypothetical protein
VASKTTILSLVAAVLAAFVLPSSASAQVVGVDRDGSVSPQRSGLTFGASIGRGSIDIRCDECGDVAPITEGLSLAAHAGYMLLPRIGIVGEHWTVRYNDRGSEWFDDSEPHLVAQRIFVAGAQAFLTNRIWLKAGLGVGWHISDSRYANPPMQGRNTEPVTASSGAAGSQDPVRPMETSDSNSLSPAFLLAAGFEFAHNEFFAADVQLRIGHTRRPQDEYQIYNTALNIGFNWY